MKSKIFFIALLFIYCNVYSQSVFVTPNSVSLGISTTAYWAGFSGNINLELWKGLNKVKDIITNTPGNCSGDCKIELQTKEWATGSDYRVKAILRSNPNIINYSNYFNVTPTLLPSVPNLTYPSNGATLNDNTPDLAWTAINANYFDIQISKNQNFTSIDFENSFCPSFNWTPTWIPNGKYYWRVSTCYNGTWSLPSTAYSFTIQVGSPCIYTLNPSNTNITSEAGTGYSFNVTTESNCNWTASVGTYSWITITSSGTKTGNGSCSYSVTKNPNNTQRVGYISVGDQMYQVTQAAANSVTSSFTVNDGYINTPIIITDNSSGNPSINSWNWDFGDGTSDTYSTYKSTFNHVYSSTGQKTISLTVKNSNNNSHLSSNTITISKPPVPITDFQSNLNNIKPYTTVLFYNTTQFGITWQWTFDGGTPSTSTEKEPSVIYKTPGVYRVKLIATNASGSVPAIKNGYITVSPNGTNQISPPPGAKIQAPQVVVSDPIQVGTGTYKYSHKDFNLPIVNGAINFTRFYNTINNTSNGSLGYGWSHTYNYYIDIQRDAVYLKDTIWSLHYPDGHIADFIPLYATSQGTYPRKSFPLYSGTLDSLVMVNSNKFTLFSKDNYQYNFNASGLLTQIVDLNNNTTTINYSGSNISSIVGQGGRSFNLTYTGSYITSVTEPNSRKYIYSYDVNGNLISAQDPKGGVMKYSYDANHRMTSVVNSLNNTIVTNTFDTQGRVIKQMDAYNQTTKLDYDTPSAGITTITNPDNSQIIATHDQFARKTNVIDELNYTTSYTYDDRSNETAFTNENGQSITRQFDWMGNVKTSTLGTNITSQYIYNICNTPTQITDPNGKATVITYDTKNNPISIHLADNTYQYFTYNSDGTKNKFTDGRNNSTTYTYSSNGDLLATIAPNGTKKYGYDLSGRLTSITDENNHQTQIVYDENDNIKTITDALSRTTEFTYDINNLLLSLKDKNGNLTYFTYDKKGRLVTNTNPKGGVTTFTYDTRDNLLSITDPNNNMVSYTYDKRGRKLSVTNSLGTTQYKYDGVGNLTNIIDATGKTIDYTYTLTNKIQSVKDGLQNTTTYTYDKNDNLLSVINALNKTTAYSYDAMNRLINVLDAASKSTIITYDETGNKKTITDPNGHVQSFTYDAANRLILQSDASGNNNSYNYDPTGNILSITTPTGVISKSYDYANRVLAVTNPGGNNYTFTYDKNDNIATMRNSIGTSTMVYDNLNQLSQYTDPYNKTVSFSYDMLGNKTSVTYPGNHKVIYQYDNANNLKSVTDWLNKTFTYTYDAAGRNTQLVYPNGIHNDINFDDAARLLNKKNTTNTNTVINSSQFVLDAVGNRISEVIQGPIATSLIPSSKTYTYSNDDVLKTNSLWNYTNDAAGNRTNETKGTKTTKYTFSVDNLLNSTTDTLGITTAFIYDPLGHRLSKTVGTAQSKYVLDLSTGLSQVLQITDASGVIKSEYVYGLGLLESIDPTNNALFYHFDGQHNTVALSNQNATITDTYSYDPFGTLLTHTGNIVQPFQFLGEYGVEQENTNLYFVRARYYDANNGRFLSKDQFLYDLNNPQTINRYVYGSNNPYLNIDPTGLFSLGMFTYGVVQYIRGAKEVAEAGVAAYATCLSTVTMNPIIVGAAGLYALNSANNAVKNFKAATFDISNSFKKGNSIIDAKLAEDDNIKGIPYFDNLVNDVTAKVLINGYAIANAVVGFVDAFGNISNITTASKYINTLPKLSKQAIGGSLLKLGGNIADIYNGVEALNKENKSNIRK